MLLRFNKIILILLFAVFLPLAANAQDAPKVEITQETATKCAQCFDQSNALRDEVKVKTEAIEGLKDEINRLRVELGKISGELIGEKAGRITDRAVIQFLLSNGRKKCYGICVQF